MHTCTYPHMQMQAHICTFVPFTSMTASHPHPHLPHSLSLSSHLLPPSTSLSSSHTCTCTITQLHFVTSTCNIMYWTLHFGIYLCESSICFSSSTTRNATSVVKETNDSGVFCCQCFIKPAIQLSLSLSLSSLFLPFSSLYISFLNLLTEVSLFCLIFLSVFWHFIFVKGYTH